MKHSLRSVITQKPITKAICFDLSNTLTKFKCSPGRQLLHRMQKMVEMDAISTHLQSEQWEKELSNQFYSTINSLQNVWPDFGVQHNIDTKLWWKNVTYNILTHAELIEDTNLRQKANSLHLITPKDDDNDTTNTTNEIMIKIYDPCFLHNYIVFNFNEYFDKLYQDFSDPLSYELFPDTRSFINFIFEKYYDSIVLGCVTHDSFASFDSVLTDLNLNYFDFVVNPNVAGCSKPSKKFYKIAKQNIYQSIQRRMIEAEINKLYGKQTRFEPYERGVKSPKEMLTDRYETDEKDEKHLLKEKEIKDAYALHFGELVSEDDINTIMVGNSIVKDIIPSLDIGWRAVLLLRSSRYLDTHKTFEDYCDELNEEGIKHFGHQEWQNRVKNRVIVVENLFDIHHNAFLV